MTQKKIGSKKPPARKRVKRAASKKGRASAARAKTNAAPKKSGGTARAVKKSVSRKAAGGRASAPSAEKSVAVQKVPAVKKTAAKKPTPAKRKAAPKPAAKKTPARKAAPAKKKTAVKKAPARATAAKGPAKPRRMSAREMESYRRLLLELRDRVVDGISFLAGENLNSNSRDQSGDLSNYSMHMADHGTDSFDRELALSMVSNEQDLIYEIEEALARIDAGTYGICEMTGEPIERERLRVIPYARYCVKAQEEMEHGRGRLRPFGASFARGGPELS